MKATLLTLAVVLTFNTKSIRYIYPAKGPVNKSHQWTIMVDKQNHTLAGDPQITFQGVAGIDPLNGFAAEARIAVAVAINEMKPAQIADRKVFKENLRIHLKRYIQKELSSKPVIVTTIVEV